MTSAPSYKVSLSFEGISLPPFKDVLILTKKCPHGKAGLMECTNLLSPENFVLVEIIDELVEALVVGKHLLKRMPADKIVGILRAEVFPYITKGEIIKVDFNVKVIIENIMMSKEL